MMPPRSIRCGCGLLLAWALLCTMGCPGTLGSKKKSVTVPITQIPVSIGHSHDHSDIAWQSESGKFYTVLWRLRSSRGNARWSPLPQATNLIGTGGKLAIVDRPPARQYRAYRIHFGQYPPKESNKPRSQNR